MTLPRDFKGIWIPKELWLDHRLTFFEKNLLAEIDSLDGDDHCYAANDHFEELFQVRERTVSEAITKLKRLGLVEQVKFDGRTRYLKSHLKTIYANFEGSASQTESSKHYFTGLTSGNPLVSPREESIEREIPLEIPSKKDISKDISKKRKSVTPLPLIEREPRVFTNSLEHEKLIKKFGSEERVLTVYNQISTWKHRVGKDGGDDYRTALKWSLSESEKITKKIKKDYETWNKEQDNAPIPAEIDSLKPLWQE